MIVVRVELHSAVTRKITEIAKMIIANDGSGTASRGNYDVRVYKKGSKEALTMREGKVLFYPRKSSHTWNLVARALESVGYK